MKKNKKGFTLIELLSVIVILSIIALIAVPIILNIIDKANKSAFKDTAYGIINAGELYYSLNKVIGNETKEQNFIFPNDIKDLQIQGKLPESGIMKINEEGQIALAISNKRYCITKPYQLDSLIVTEEIDNCVIPILIENITLVDSEINLNEGEKNK